MQAGSQAATIRDIRAVTGEAEGNVGTWRKHPTHLEGQAVDTGERRKELAEAKKQTNARHLPFRA